MLSFLVRVLEEGHHGAEFFAYALYWVAGVFFAEAVEARAAFVVFGYPLAGEAAVLYVGQDLLHILLDALVYDYGAAGVVAVLGGVANGVAHILEAALVEEVHYELELVHTLEVGGFGLVSSLDEGLECTLDQLGDAAAEDGLLSEQVGLGLFLEGGFEDAGAGAADAARVGEAEGFGLAGYVLMDSEQAPGRLSLG